jgi:hypothetical protein
MMMIVYTWLQALVLLFLFMLPFFSFLYLYCFGIRTGIRLGRRTIDITQTLFSLLSCVTFITELTVLPPGEHIKFCTLLSMVAIPCVLRITLTLANQFMSHSALTLILLTWRKS